MKDITIIIVILGLGTDHLKNYTCIYNFPTFP